MACMLPLIKRNLRRVESRKRRATLAERDSHVRPANAEIGGALRLSEPTSEHAGETGWTSEEFGLMESKSLSRAPVKKAALLQCVDCGLTFDGLDELRDHLKGEEGEPSHVCPLHCGAAFSTQVSLWPWCQVLDEWNQSAGLSCTT